MQTQGTILENIAKFFNGPADPRERLEMLERDRLNAEAEIRAVLDGLAAKYDVASEDISVAMVSIGLAVGDMTYEAEIGYLEEIEVTPPV